MKNGSTMETKRQTKRYLTKQGFLMYVFPKELTTNQNNPPGLANSQSITSRKLNYHKLFIFKQMRKSSYLQLNSMEVLRQKRT